MSQEFTIDRYVVPAANGMVWYYLRKGFIGNGERLEVQATNDGVSWTTIQAFNANAIASQFQAKAVALEEGVPVKIRFVLKWVAGGTYQFNDSRVGCFIDSISFPNCNWYTSESFVDVPSGQDHARLDSSTLEGALEEGQQRTLILRATLGGREYPSRTPLNVTFTGGVDGFAAWLNANHPTLSGDFGGDPDEDGLSSGLEYAFGLDPGETSRLSKIFSKSQTGLSLRTPLDTMRPGVVYELETSHDLLHWSTNGTTVSIIDGELVGTCPPQGECGFLRWKVTDSSAGSSEF